MSRNSLWMACIVTVFALGGLGAGDCDPFIISDCEEGFKDCYGECIPVDEACIPPGCSEGEKLCPDGSCVPVDQDCPATDGCGVLYECADGTCAEGAWECCRLAGNCDPNRYSEQSQGSVNTSSYTNRILSDGSVGNSNGAILSVNSFAEGDPVRYWVLQEVTANGQAVDMFPTGARVNRLYDFIDANGDYIQDPVIQYVPGDSQYSPLVQQWLVHVPAGYTADAMKSVTAINSAGNDPETGILVEPTDSVRVVEVTAESMGLHRINDVASGREPIQLPVWRNGFRAHAWFDFLTSHTDEVSLYVDVSDASLVTPPQPMPANLFQFDGCNGRNVFEEKNLPGRDLYSPFTIRTYVRMADGSTVSNCTGTPTSAANLFDNTSYSLATADMYMVTPMFPQ